MKTAMIRDKCHTSQRTNMNRKKASIISSPIKLQLKVIGKKNDKLRRCCQEKLLTLTWNTTYRTKTATKMLEEKVQAFCRYAFSLHF